jgi:hypothetical protein
MFLSQSFRRLALGTHAYSSGVTADVAILEEEFGREYENYQSVLEAFRRMDEVKPALVSFLSECLPTVSLDIIRFDLYDFIQVVQDSITLSFDSPPPQKKVRLEP